MTAMWVFEDHDPWDDGPVMQFTNGRFNERETIMTTKTARTASTTTAKTARKSTTANAKETTMTTTPKPAPTKLSGKEQRAAELAELKAKYDAPAFTDPVNAHNILKAIYEAEQTGEEVAPKGIYAAPDELEYLCWIAREYGWTNNAFVSKSQVPALHGVVKEGARSVKLFPVKGFPGT